MRRGIVLGVMIGAGALAVAAQQGGQQPGPRVVEVDKVKDNLYMFKGGGGNTGVFVTANGVIVVDTKNPGWGQPVLDKIKTITDKPVTVIIDTHTHGDHVSGQVEFPGNIEIVAQANTKTNMEKLDLYKKPENTKFLPKKTFTDKMSLLTGKDKIDLYYFGPGHTNGDLWVVFPSLRVAHVADMFPNKQPPFMDGANGGSGVAFPQTLAKAVDGIKDVDTLINGHNPTVTTWADLKEYVDFTKDFVTWTQQQKKAGKSVDETAAAYKVPEKFKGYTTNMRVKGDVQLIYDETK